MAKSKWVKLPEGAQVSMSREEFEASQVGMSVGTRALLGGALIAGLWLYGAYGPDHNGENTTDNKPTPQTSVSAPVKTGE